MWDPPPNAPRSPDGKYYWDGFRWVAIQTALAGPPPFPSDLSGGQSHDGRIVAITCGLVLLLLIGLALVTVTFIIPSLSKKLTTSLQGADLADSAVTKQLLIQPSQMPADWTHSSPDEAKDITFIKQGDACVGADLYTHLTAGWTRYFAYKVTPNKTDFGQLYENVYSTDSVSSMQAWQAAEAGPQSLPCLIADAQSDLAYQIQGDALATTAQPTESSTNRGAAVGAFSIEVDIPFTYKSLDYIYRKEVISMASGRFRYSLWFSLWETASYGDAAYQQLLVERHETDIVATASQDLTAPARGQLATPTPRPSS